MNQVSRGERDSCQSLDSLLRLERKCPQRLLSGSLGITSNNSRSCGAELGWAGQAWASAGRALQDVAGVVPRRRSLFLELLLLILSCDLLSLSSPMR